MQAKSAALVYAFDNAISPPMKSANGEGEAASTGPRTPGAKSRASYCTSHGRPTNVKVRPVFPSSPTIMELMTRTGPWPRTAAAPRPNMHANWRCSRFYLGCRVFMNLSKSTSDRTAMWHTLPTEKLVDMRTDCQSDLVRGTESSSVTGPCLSISFVKCGAPPATRLIPV
jgi:hypothetical protein